MRQGIATPLVEQHCAMAMNQDQEQVSFEQFPKLASVIAYGIGDGAGHSIALISRKKSDFTGDWSNLKYGTMELDDEDDFDHPMEEVGDDGISRLDKLFQEEETLDEICQKPSLSFSDYIHMDDDEHFPLKILKGMVNVVAMNIVVMYYLLGRHPNDSDGDEIEDEDKVLSYIEKLVEALGEKFKKEL